MSGCFGKLFGNFEQDGGARAAPDRVRALRNLEAAQSEASRQLALSRAAENALERAMAPRHAKLRQLAKTGQTRTRAALELQRQIVPLVRDLKSKRVATAHNERIMRQLSEQLDKMQRSDLHAVASSALRNTTPYIAASTTADAMAFRDAAEAANETLAGADDAEQEIEGELDDQFNQRDKSLGERFESAEAALAAGADADGLLGDLDALLGGAFDDVPPDAEYEAPRPAPAERAPVFEERRGRAPPTMPAAPTHSFDDYKPSAGGTPTLLADWSLNK